MTRLKSMLLLQVLALGGITHAMAQAPGELFWYRHTGRSRGTAVWANGGSRIQIGSGFGVFNKVFAADDGVIYGVTPAGDLYWYQHQGRSDGTAVWANGGTGIKIGSGFGVFNKLFAANDGVIYGVTTAGDLYWYQHQGRSDGTAVWANGGTGLKVGSGWTFSQVFAANDSVIYGIE